MIIVFMTIPLLTSVSVPKHICAPRSLIINRKKDRNAEAKIVRIKSKVTKVIPLAETLRPSNRK